MSSATETKPETVEKKPAEAKLPRGIAYRFRADRPDLPHQYGVRDRDLGRYAWESYSDKAKGLAAAKDLRRRMDAGEATAVRALVADIGPEYGKQLAAQKARESYRKSVATIVAKMLEAGCNDMAAPGFAAKVQAWLDGLTAARKGQKDPTEAAPRTKRLALTVARALCHYAMQVEGRPLRFDPLQRVAIPKISKFDKPVFSIPELRLIVGDVGRFAGSKLRLQADKAVADAGGSKAKAAAALKVHLSTLYYRIQMPIADDPWWLFAVLGIYTGARPSEVQFLEWEWVSLTEEVIELPASAPGNKMRVGRTIPIQPELLAILKARHKEGMTGYILPPIVTKADESTRTKAFQAYVGRCGLPINGRGPHSMRHNHGAICTAMKMNAAGLMLAMGHDSIKVAQDYARTAPRFRKDVAGWGSEAFRLMRVEG